MRSIAFTPLPKHGTELWYKKKQCRCPSCVKAHHQHLIQVNKDRGKYTLEGLRKKAGAKYLAHRIESGELDGREVMRYAIEKGYLPPETPNRMDLDEFRGWIRRNKDFTYEKPTT